MMLRPVINKALMCLHRSAFSVCRCGWMLGKGMRVPYLGCVGNITVVTLHKVVSHPSQPLYCTLHLS